MKITFENAKVLRLLKEIEVMNKEINEIIDEWKKKDQYIGKLNLKVERCKEKLRPIVATEVKRQVELKEFELVGATKRNGEKIEVEIYDQIEMIKDNLRKQKNASDKEAKTNKKT